MAIKWNVTDKKKKEEPVVQDNGVLPVNTEGGVTRGQYGSYAPGTISKFDDPYAAQARRTMGQIERYTGGNYASRYQSDIDKYLGLLGSEYDPNSDPSYLAYKNQYLRGGQKAMQDTMAKAVALSGGFDNSYANSVGQQTYNEYTAALADKIPELAQAAQDMYMNRLGLYMDLDNRDYGRYRDKRDDLYDLLGLYNNESDRAYDRFNQEQSRYNTALNQALAMLQGGGGSGGSGGGRGSSRSSGSGNDYDLLEELRYADSKGADPYDMWAYAQDQVKDANDLAKQTGMDPAGLINAIRKAAAKRK